MRVAAVQLSATDDRDRNLATAEALVARAADAGGVLAVLPELFNLMGGTEVMRAGAEHLDGPTISWARETAASRGVWLLAGSITERIEGDDRTHNTSCLVSPAGELAAVYRKIHLFDNDIPGAAFRESASVAPGAEIVSTTVEGVQVGLSVCYDLRFPELYRVLALRGASIVAVPSAFTARTGADHWEPLLRARAIENQVFIVAPDQFGTGPAGITLYGHSMIVDPWGTPLAVAPEGEGVITAELDLVAQEDLRRRLPSLANRRPAAYGALNGGEIAASSVSSGPVPYPGERHDEGSKS